MGKADTKFLHIIPPERYSMSKYIRMTIWDFERSNHTFLCNTYAQKGSDEILLYGNVLDWRAVPTKRVKKIAMINQMTKQADVIIFHSFVPTWPWLVYLYMHPAVRKKSTFVLWERDLFGLKIWKKGRWRKILQRPLERMAMHCKQNFGAYVTGIPPYAELASKFSENIQIAPYEFYEHVFETADSWREQKAATNKTRVWVSNYVTGAPELFQQLNKFSNEDIRLFTFEDKRETDDVCLDQLGCRIFEKTFRFPVRLSEQRMIKLISALDIGIFDQYMYTNTFHMLMFLYMGKKVFLHEDNPWYAFFKKKGLDVYTIESIDTMSFGEFSAPALNPEAGNWIKEYFSHDNVAHAWGKVFETLSNTLAKERKRQ